MSDDPRKLKTVLLEDATTEEQRQFAELLAQQCAIADRQQTHRDWLYIPSPTEYERMRKYWGGDEKCPKCPMRGICANRPDLRDSLLVRIQTDELDFGKESE